MGKTRESSLRRCIVPEVVITAPRVEYGRKIGFHEVVDLAAVAGQLPVEPKPGEKVDPKAKPELRDVTVGELLRGREQCFEPWDEKKAKAEAARLEAEQRSAARDAEPPATSDAPATDGGTE